MSPSRSRRPLLAASVSVTLALGGVVLAAAPASAAPPSFSISPASGSILGGTEVTVDPPAGVELTSVSGAYYHSLALGSDGSTYAWGAGSVGRLGDGGSNTNTFVPVKVAAPVGVTFISVSAGGSHSLALGSDGRSYAWGSDEYGQLGDGGAKTNRPTPVVVSAPVGVTFTSVSAGFIHSLAVGSDGNAYAWGADGVGRLGDDAANMESTVPVRVAAPVGVSFTSVSAGGNHSLAVGSDGNAYAWGYDGDGQLGDGGSNTDRFVPVRVAAPVGVTFTTVVAGGVYSLALGSDGHAYAWGRGGDGQMGDGNSSTSNPVPVRVSAPVGVTFTSVSAGGFHSLAVGSDGNTYAWGQGSVGQLGDGGSAPSSLVPVVVSTPAGVTFTSVSAGDGRSVALGSDGKAYAWGSGIYGGLGAGSTTTNSPVPVEVWTPAVSVTSVAFGGVVGTDLAYDAASGTWTVTTPAHTAGPVDVVVAWTLGSVVQDPLTLTSGFTYAAVAPAAPSELAATGADIGVPAAVAGILLALGLLLTGRPRRRAV